MVNILQKVKGNINIVMMFLPILSFIAPFLILYSLYAWTFEQAYHGRTFLLFFLWLVALEMILSWEKLRRTKVNRPLSIRTVLFLTALLLPTIYVVAANYYGLNTIISSLVSQWVSPINIDSTQKIIIAGQIPISIEYLVFAVLFCVIILLLYGINILTDFSISILFSGIIGLLFITDQLYPNGGLTPLQAPVPLTTTLAAKVLNIMGYRTSVSAGLFPGLFVLDPNNPFRRAGFTIAWPCAGVESLLLFSITILLFLKKTGISWKIKAVYFALGGVVTYFINILRIVTIFLIAMDYGSSSIQFQMFHNYYGMLYSMSWIVFYPLIIIGSQMLWNKIKNRNRVGIDSLNFQAARPA